MGEMADDFLDQVEDAEDMRLGFMQIFGYWPDDDAEREMLEENM